MKKYIFLILFLITTFSYAQTGKKLERIKALRIAYISNKLNLTQEESEKFWPVFNTFDTKQFDLRSKKKKLMLRLKPENSKLISDKEMVNALNESEDLDNQIQQNRRVFVKSLQGIISAQKILILKQSEDDFKNEILKQIKNRKQNKE
jgi:hypothetical protein